MRGRSICTVALAVLLVFCGPGMVLSQENTDPATEAAIGVSAAVTEAVAVQDTDVVEPSIEPASEQATGPVDLCPGLPEVENGFEDDDGCPDTIAITLKGKLVRSESLEPLAGTLTLVGKHGVSKREVVGPFNWVVPKPGTYTLLAEVEGYGKQVSRVYVTPGQSVVLTLQFGFAQ